MKSLKELDSVGWGFFGVLCLLFVAPAMYLSFSYLPEGDSPGQTVGLRIFGGVSLTAIAAAVIAFIVNAALQARAGAGEEARTAHSGPDYDDADEVDFEDQDQDAGYDEEEPGADRAGDAAGEPSKPVPAPRRAPESGGEPGAGKRKRRRKKKKKK